MGALGELGFTGGEHMTQPQDDIYLIAAPFQLYREPGAGFEAQVYLRRPDPELARRYLEATRPTVSPFPTFEKVPAYE